MTHTLVQVKIMIGVSFRVLSVTESSPPIQVWSNESNHNWAADDWLKRRHLDSTLVWFGGEWRRLIRVDRHSPNGWECYWRCAGS